MNAPVATAGVIGGLRASSSTGASCTTPRPSLRRACGWMWPLILIRLPLFDEDLEADGLPADRRRAGADPRADEVLLATPEYNFGVPGPVKNFVDWASRPPGRGAFVGKPVALIGASTGRSRAPCRPKVSCASRSP